jgi:hypothetical protein
LARSQSRARFASPFVAVRARSQAASGNPDKTIVGKCKDATKMYDTGLGLTHALEQCQFCRSVC